MNRFPIEKRAISARSSEQFIPDGIENNADERLTVFDQTDGCGETRIAVREVRGAVERIDVPDVWRSRRRSRAFLRHYVVGWKVFAELGEDQGLGAAVRFGH